MAATVTTPTAVPGNVTAPPTLAAMSPTSMFADAMHVVFKNITATGVTHLAIPMPMSRWNGTSWVRTYSPSA